MHETTPDHRHVKGPVIGLALGSGAARGWAHLGVIRALEREGIQPHVISGCSSGAFVGAALASGYIGQLTEWAESLKWQDVMSLMDVSLRGGLIKGQKLAAFVRRSFVDRQFSELDRPFACVATELDTGREIWLREGSVVDAVRASMALPGLLTPVVHGRKVLVDGGLVNPVPVSLCRAMGADVVIGVELGSGMVGKTVKPSVQEEDSFFAWPEKLLERLGIFAGGDSGEAGSSLPSMITVMTTSINIMQARIARSRLAGEPADVQLSPRVAQLGPIDFHRAREAIAEGEAAVERMLPALRYALGHA